MIHSWSVFWGKAILCCFSVRAWFIFSLAFFFAYMAVRSLLTASFCTYYVFLTKIYFGFAPLLSLTANLSTCVLHCCALRSTSLYPLVALIGFLKRSCGMCPKCFLAGSCAGVPACLLRYLSYGWLNLGLYSSDTLSAVLWVFLRSWLKWLSALEDSGRDWL